MSAPQRDAMGGCAGAVVALALMLVVALAVVVVSFLLD